LSYIRYLFAQIYLYRRGILFQLVSFGSSSIESAIAGVLLKLAPKDGGGSITPTAGVLLKLDPRGGRSVPIGGVLLQLSPKADGELVMLPRGGVLLQLAPRGGACAVSVKAGVLFQLASSGFAVPPNAGVLFQPASRSGGALVAAPKAGVLFQQDPVGTGPFICFVSTTTKFTVPSSSVICVFDMSEPISREVKCCPTTFARLISGRKHASETAVIPNPTSITVRLIIGAEIE
jgi:hypothetical protein